jgi:hypothetical protein
MSNLATLKPFKKGDDPRRNTNGANKGSISIMGEIKSIWAKDPKGFKKWVKNAMADKMLRREIIQQVDGKPKEHIEFSGGIALSTKKLNDTELEHIATGSKD